LIIVHHLQNAPYRGGAATGGVNTSGDLGFGGRAMMLGAGRTSIGGGRGAACWVRTGAFGLGGRAAAGGRGTPTLGFNGARRWSRPGTGTSESG
jgi:hypothetical protein